MADDKITEPDNSTVDDWLGQEVNRDQDLADEAMRKAGGDETEAEKIFNEHTAANEPEAVESVAEQDRP